MPQVNTQVETFTWPKLSEAPERPGVYAWYVRLALGEADLSEFEQAVEAKRQTGGNPAPIVQETLEQHFFHPFQETAYSVKLSGALKPRYVGELLHQPATSEGLIERLSNDPARLRPIANVLGAAAPFFTAPLYIGMARNLRARLAQHKSGIESFADNPAAAAGNDKISGFAQQIVQRGFNPRRLFVVCIPVGDVDSDEQLDLENILNRINFPIFGRN